MHGDGGGGSGFTHVDIGYPKLHFFDNSTTTFPPLSFWLLLASCFLSKLAGKKKKKIGFIVCQVLFPYVAGSQKRVGGGGRCWKRERGHFKTC